MIEMAFVGPFTKEGCPFCPLFSMDRTMAALMGHSSSTLSMPRRRDRTRPISCCSYHPTNKGRVVYSFSQNWREQLRRLNHFKSIQILGNATVSVFAERALPETAADLQVLRRGASGERHVRARGGVRRAEGAVRPLRGVDHVEGLGQAHEPAARRSRAAESQQDEEAHRAAR